MSRGLTNLRRRVLQAGVSPLPTSRAGSAACFPGLRVSPNRATGGPAPLFAAICVIACLLGGAAPAALAAKPPATWDGLTLVKSKRFDAVYLAPDADFSSYRKVMLDPTEVAFRKNWVSDYNSTVMGLSSRL